MSQYVVLPKHPYVYNWKTGQSEWLTPEEHQRRRDQQHQAEAAGNAQETPDEPHDTDAPTLDRVPISTGETANTAAHDAYITEILTTDKELQTTQVEGAEAVV